MARIQNHDSSTADAVKKLQRARDVDAAEKAQPRRQTQKLESSFDAGRAPPVALTPPPPPARASVAPELPRQAQELSDYARQKLGELGASHPAAPYVAELKAAADRALTGQPVTDPDKQLLDRLARARASDAIDALDHPRASGLKATDAEALKKLKGVQPWQGNDPRRDRVQREIARRMGKDWSKLTEAERQRIAQLADKMANTLSNKKGLAKGYEVLEAALKNRRIGVGLAGIKNGEGGERSSDELDETKKNMHGAGGEDVDAVIENTNSAVQAAHAAVDENQLKAFRELAQFMNQMGVRVDVTAHSNGFNALARACRDSNPPIRLGRVTLINPNIPTNPNSVLRDMKAIVAHSDHVALVTSVNDGAVAWSGAGIVGGPAWKKQIEAAIAAGVQDIRVYRKAGHSLDSMAEARNQEPPDLDFWLNPKTGRMEPRDPDAWRRSTGYRWDPEKGFVYDPMRRPRPGPGDVDDVRAA